MRRIFHGLLLAGAAVMGAATPGAAVSDAAPMTLQYGLYIGGIPLGTVTLDSRIGGERYETAARFSARGWLQPFLRAEGLARSAGLWAEGAPRARSFSYDLRGREPRVTRMTFDASGAPDTVVAEPPFDPKPYQISIEDVGAAVDPAAAAALLTGPRAEPCRLDLRVFDGRKLHGIRLSPLEDAGALHRCTGRYERLGGFKDKMMTPERRAYDFEAEIERLPGGFHRPRIIRARTPLGMATVVLNEE